MPRDPFPLSAFARELPAQALERAGNPPPPIAAREAALRVFPGFAAARRTALATLPPDSGSARLP